MVCGTISDLTLILLFIASLLSIIVKEIVEEEKSVAWVEGFGIFLVAVVVVAVTSVLEYKKEGKMHAAALASVHRHHAAPPSSLTVFS